MSNKAWDKISYNQSSDVELKSLQKKWEELTKQRPIEEATYQQITTKEAQQKKIGTDVY